MKFEVTFSGFYNHFGLYLGLIIVQLKITEQ